MKTSCVALASALVVLVPLLLPGCGGPASPVAIPPAGSLVLYEGLPHPGYEPGAFEQEKESKPTTEILGYSFYKEPLVLKDADRAVLREILGAASTYKPFGGEKKCGGFHPDYAFEWSDEGKTHGVLLCFGCGEAKRFGPSGESRYDLPSDVRKRLRALLEPYATNRPRPKVAPG